MKATVLMMSCCFFLSACGSDSVYLPADCSVVKLITDEHGRQTVTCADGRTFSATPGTKIRSSASD